MILSVVRLSLEAGKTSSKDPLITSQDRRPQEQRKHNLCISYSNSTQLTFSMYLKTFKDYESRVRISEWNLSLTFVCLHLITVAPLPKYGQPLLKKDKRTLSNLLRKMSKKGYYETLSFICQKGSAHYADILDYNLKNAIVQSRATVTLIVRNLAALGLIKRTIVDSRPIRTIYQPTEKGQKLLKHLHTMEQL